MPNLVIFDIDGTLINSSKVDADCYVRAAEETFGITNIDTRWGNYRHVTDGAIFEELFENHFGRKPTEQEIKRQIEKFVLLLQESFGKNALLFKEVSGAGATLRALTHHPQWKPAVATGAWREAALFKLQASGLDAKGLPLVTSSDFLSRESIIRKSISLAENIYAVRRFEKIVSVGDALWDRLTAKKLGLAFIKVSKTGANNAAGSSHVVKDFSDFDRFLRFLEEAAVPE